MLMLLLVSRATSKPALARVFTTSARLLICPDSASCNRPLVMDRAASCLFGGRLRGCTNACRLAGSLGS